MQQLESLKINKSGMESEVNSSYKTHLFLVFPASF